MCQNLCSTFFRLYSQIFVIINAAMNIYINWVFFCIFIFLGKRTSLILANVLGMIAKFILKISYSYTSLYKVDRPIIKYLQMYLFDEFLSICNEYHLKDIEGKVKQVHT